jgi:HTH-type transcriptional regulator, competence development regulator
MDKLFKKELEAFGERLLAIRKEKGLSQADLESLSGIARTEISKIENGHKNIELITIVKLALALGVPVSSFFQEH